MAKRSGSAKAVIRRKTQRDNPNRVLFAIKVKHARIVWKVIAIIVNIGAVIFGVIDMLKR